MGVPNAWLDRQRMWRACSAATFAKNPTKVSDSTSPTKTAANPANTIAFSPRDNYFGWYAVGWVSRAIDRYFFAGRRESRRATPDSTGSVIRRYASAADVVKA